MPRLSHRTARWSRLILLALAACGIATAPAAETRRIEEHNFTMDTPDWWMAITPPPQGSALALESPRKDRSLVVITSELPPREHGVTREEMVASARKMLEAQGFEIKHESPVDSGGLTWTALEAAALRVKLLLWIAVVPGQGYLIRADNKAGGNPAEDPEMLAALRSFHLLWPVRPDGSIEIKTVAHTGLADPDTSPGTMIAVIATCVGLAVLMVLLAIFTRRGKKRRRPPA